MSHLISTVKPYDVSIEISYYDLLEGFSWLSEGVYDDAKKQAVGICDKSR